MVIRVPVRTWIAESPGRPKFLGSLDAPMPCSLTPAGPITPGRDGGRRGPRVRENEGSPRVSISRGSMDGVDAGCLRFAVRLTPPHARLASGCWPGSTGRDWLPTRLQRKVSEVIVTSRPPFPSFSWRNTKSAPNPVGSTCFIRVIRGSLSSQNSQVIP